MQKIRILVKIIIFFVIYIGVQSLLKFVLLDDTNTISRVMIHDMYSQEKNIDVLFCGASHCQLGINPYIMDEALGKNTFNAGSSSQGLETSLALIKEVAANNDLEQVFVDLDYSIVMRDTPNLESIYIISDYMRPSVRKFSYLLNATPFDYYLNSFMPLHKGCGYAKTFGEISELLRRKSDAGYWNYTNVDPSYGGKGYIASRTVVAADDPVFTDEYVNVSGEIPESSVKYINQIIEFCDKKNIELVFINIPITDYRASRMNCYDEFINAIDSLTASKGVKYYDFNLYRPEVLPLNDIKYYNDDNHLNVEGSTVFAMTFGAFIKGDISEEDIFYPSFADKYGR